MDTGVVVPQVGDRVTVSGLGAGEVICSYDGWPRFNDRYVRYFRVKFDTDGTERDISWDFDTNSWHYNKLVPAGGSKQRLDSFPCTFSAA